MKWIMTIGVVVFLVSLLFGQLGGIMIAPGVTMYLHDIILVFLGGLYLISPKDSIHPTLVFSMKAFLVVGILSLLFQTKILSSVELFHSSLYLIRWFMYAMIYVVVVKGHVSTRLWIWGIYFVGVILALGGIMQFVLYPNLANLSYLGWDPHYYRLFSTFLDPNFIGIFIVLTMILGVYLVEKTKKRYVVILAEIVLFFALLLTYSRSSYLAFFISVIVIFVRSRRWLTLGAIVTLFVVMVISMPRIGGEILRIDRIDSVISRLENWQWSFSMFARAPILGHGFNTLRFSLSSSLPKSSVDPVSKAGAGVDSSLLFILDTTGIVGLFAYGWLIYQMMRLAVFGYKRGNQTLGNIYCAALAAILLHSLFVNSLFYPWIMIWMWIVSGVVERAVIYDR